jgi:lipopolysaccharide biosynthesis glycosyltransferase
LAVTAADDSSKMDVTYYTVSDHRFFLGTVALLNSLRVTGNAGELVVLDAGLTSDQRKILEGHATLFDPPQLAAGHPGIMKAYPYLLDAHGTVVVIDSDIVVTGSLQPALDFAREGKICACPPWTEEVRNRWFAEWETALELRAPLRREAWVHNGFVVFSTEHWPGLLERWWEVCELVPVSEMYQDTSLFQAPDADALNALLMSEIPRDALALLPDGDEAFGGHITIDDPKTLSCRLDGRPTRIVHYPDSPKPWDPYGWLRLGVPAYARILQRLYFADDVPLRLDPKQVPLWLRTTSPGSVAYTAVTAANRAIGWSSRVAPEPVRERLRNFRQTMFSLRSTWLKDTEETSAETLSADKSIR